MIGSQGPTSGGLKDLEILIKCESVVIPLDFIFEKFGFTRVGVGVRISAVCSLQ
jgi:hypothetical protein